jgi:hypothetical protein
MKMKNLLTMVLVGLMVASLTLTAEAQQKNINKTITSVSATKTVPVTWKNFVRAESDKMFNNYVTMGAFGKFLDLTEPTPIDQQKVVRMNRDTLYSMAVFDLTTPVTIIKPDTGDRFQSMQVISEDQYTQMVVYKPGTYTLTQEKVGTRYVMVLVRTLVDSNNPQDIKKVNAIQHEIKMAQKSPGKFEIPNWDKASQDKVRAALKTLASTMSDYSEAFGRKSEVNPVEFLLASSVGWGGNPQKDAKYVNVIPKMNDGKTAYVLNVKNVPVDGFWSISLYNAKGYFQKNKYNSYSVNNITGTKNKDDSITIHFGGDPKQSNYLPIMGGWNYTVRLYLPQKKILDGSWTFPKPQLVK